MQKYDFWNPVARVVVMLFLIGCGSDAEGDNNGVDYFEGDPEPVHPGCNSVRLTAYDASDGGWCEFDRSHDFLPEFVHQGLTLAIAEPWNGGSFAGDPGEACGQCWEIDTISETRIVMVHDLCPIDGNPLCSGGHFHFDLASEAGTILGGGGLDEASARPVPCPVTGDIHIQINDANEWGYLRVAFINHRIPIRRAAVRALPDGPWIPMERSGGAWHVVEGPTAEMGDGIGFQLESAEGEIVESETSLNFNPTENVFDLGVQFVGSGEDDSEVCLFTPPGDVYVDNWGGIEGVLWQPNPWGETEIAETGEGCSEGSDSCLKVTHMNQWEGAHLYYRQPFPTSTFSTLTLQIFGVSGGGELAIAPSNDGERCTETTVNVTEGSWTSVSIDIAADCTAQDALNGVSFSNNSPEFSFLLDSIRFE